MLPVEHNDPINEKILAISEDKIEGFVGEPFQEIADRVGVAADVVMARIAAMLHAGTIRRVRQTLLATNLADGALVAWKVPEAKVDAAFDFMFRCDPFSGHVVLRSTDTLTAGSDYKLWTTVKVPHGFSLEEHCRLLAEKTGAERFRIMPAKGIFTLGVGHVRRKTIEPGSRAESPAKIIEVRAVELSEREWKVLLALKRELAPEEIRPRPWVSRAREADVSLEEFYCVAEELNARKIIGRFSTFLEHVKPSAGGVRVTRFNALFHWAIPAGREIETGGEVGRHHILTHCYWRKPVRNSRMSTSWRWRTARTKHCCSSIKRRSIDILPRAAFQFHTPTSSGADAARSNHRKFRRKFIVIGCARWSRKHESWLQPWLCERRNARNAS